MTDWPSAMFIVSSLAVFLIAVIAYVYSDRGRPKI